MCARAHVRAASSRDMRQRDERRAEIVAPPSAAAVVFCVCMEPRTHCEYRALYIDTNRVTFVAFFWRLFVLVVRVESNREYRDNAFSTRPTGPAFRLHTTQSFVIVVWCYK